MKQVLVLGGSGRTGRFVVQRALAAGMSVNALVRRPEVMTGFEGNLNLIQGTPTSIDNLREAMKGCDAIISTLNNNRVSDSPFAKPANGPTLLTDCIKNTIAVMKEQGVSRISLLGAAGVGDSFATAAWFLRVMIKRTNLGYAYRDHEGVEAALKASTVDWTVGRAVMLGKKFSEEPVIESYVVRKANLPKPAMQISRDNVAKWLIDSLTRPDLIGKTPQISQK